MIKLYFNSGPNPMKVALCLEEMGLPYEPVPIETRQGDQHTDSFRAINPNGKAPAIVEGDVTVFDSNAILLYLATKTGDYLHEDSPAARGELLSWLMFVATGVGPYSGQSVHFRLHAPEQVPYAINRYSFEAERHYAILDARLAERAYLLGSNYTIVDMAAWGWARMIPRVLGDDAWQMFPNLKRLVDEISARPAAVRAQAMVERFAFRMDMNDDARVHMFPQNAKLTSQAGQDDS